MRNMLLLVLTPPYQLMVNINKQSREGTPFVRERARSFRSCDTWTRRIDLESFGFVEEGSKGECIEKAMAQQKRKEYVEWTISMFNV